MNGIRRITLIGASLALALAGPAFAQAVLVSSAPAASATVANVRTVTLNFDRAILPRFSGLEIVMTGMPGMAGHHPAMKVPGVKVSVSADGKALVAVLARPLVPGSYDVDWHGAGADAQRAAGKVSFTVR